jgi:hypothetical protein
MARSKITERDGKIVFQGVEYTVDQWAMKKKAEADVEARQKELAEQRKRPVFIPSENTLDRIRLFLWLVIAIIAFPFACVVQASFWLLDLVAGDKFPRLRFGVQKKEKVAGDQFPWEKMRGAVPDLTDGLSSEAFVRKQRDEWDSTPTKENKDD